ncbi:MAG: cysteine synthase A [Deltaproteobacteria bacterium]|nr:cysteine synthase A [Deltaproteobacteria bacterium]
MDQIRKRPKIAKDMTELVGYTPLVEILSWDDEVKSRIIAKLEYFNPLSSVKDRIALAMIEGALKDGSISSETTVVEPTSGNTGVGIAWVCAVKGLKCILIMPDTMSIERRKLLKALGAELVLTPGSEGMKGAINKSESLCIENEKYFSLGQFSNPANPGVHRHTTAVEIWNDTDGRLDILVAGVGTGGTITGCGEALKQFNSDIRVFAVEPDSSAVLSGENSGPHKIQGIGAGFIPEILNTDSFDGVIRIKDEDAGETARLLAKTNGILCGISGGAAMRAAMELGKNPENNGKTIVVIIPDTGERYLSTWLYS